MTDDAGVALDGVDAAVVEAQVEIPVLVTTLYGSIIYSLYDVRTMLDFLQLYYFP